MDIKPSADMKIRSLSEEFYSRSPNTRLLIKTMVSTSPTSKFIKEFSNADVYNSASPDEKIMMVQYGLISPNKIIRL